MFLAVIFFALKETGSMRWDGAKTSWAPPSCALVATVGLQAKGIESEGSAELLEMLQSVAARCFRASDR